jgi:hypothetical protein
MSLTNSATLKSILEKDKLNGKNFLDWNRHLRIVLRQDRKEYVLEKAVPKEAPAKDADKEAQDEFLKHVSDNTDVACLMLATMEPELQKQFETLEAFAMMELLKEMFQRQARIERYNTQLHGMLKAAEENMKSKVGKDALMVRKAKPMKKKSKGKSKGSGCWKAKGKGKVLPGVKNTNQKDDLCFHCNKPGHWKRSCKLLMEEKKKGSMATTSGIFVIEVNLSTSTSWVLDTG